MYEAEHAAREGGGMSCCVYCRFYEECAARGVEECPYARDPYAEEEECSDGKKG